MLFERAAAGQEVENGQLEMPLWAAMRVYVGYKDVNQFARSVKGNQLLYGDSAQVHTRLRIHFEGKVLMGYTTHTLTLDIIIHTLLQCWLSGMIFHMYHMLNIGIITEIKCGTLGTWNTIQNSIVHADVISMISCMSLTFLRMSC